jgi:GTPase-associated protein 1, N-terminal domain type 1
MPAEFKLHQAIFGYDAGHNLLVASCPLSSESRRLLAVLTDTSGPWPASGFDHAITGTPLPDMPYYALFCTWLAPEMPRPGCVWSHVLLIELADLAALADLGELRNCFQKPAEITKKSGCEPLRFVAKRDKVKPVAQGLKKVCEQFLIALYAAPKSHLVIPAPNSEIYESVVFDLWSQQWPRLRRSFRFSTGSFADRGRSGEAFDLQITPESNSRTWLRGDDNLFIETGKQSTDLLSVNDQDWINIALDDLLAPDTKNFRSFLNTNGADVNNPRGAFGRLTIAYELLTLQPDGDWAEKLRSIAEIFPDKNEALRLKEGLVTPTKSSNSTQALERAWVTTSFLLGSREARAYSSVSFDHAGQAPILWRERRDEALSLIAQLVRQNENPAASAFVAAIANTVQPGELQLISDRHPELISILLNHRPALAFDVSTWQLPSRIQWQITEVLDRLSLEQKSWGDIMTAKFFAATDVAVRETVKKAGAYAIQGAFRWLETQISQEFLPSELWREALAAPAAARLADPELLPPASLALCAWFVPPETARQLLTITRQDVQQLALQSLDILPRPLRLPTAFLLVTIGLRATSTEGLKPLKRGYFEVYDALAETNFPWESWLLLSAELPQPGWWKDWDRCERLRRAVRQWLFQYVKTGDPLIDAAASKKHNEIARQTLAEENDDEKFID